MSFDDQLVAIEAVVQAIGAALPDPMTDVCLGMPVPRGRCARIWWDGEADAVRMPGRFTLDSELTGDRIVARGFWPIPSADEAAHAARVKEMAAFAHGVRTAIDANQDLGENADAIDVDHAETDLVLIGSVLFAIVDIPMTLSYRETEIS